MHGRRLNRRDWNIYQLPFILVCSFFQVDCMVIFEVHTTCILTTECKLNACGHNSITIAQILNASGSLLSTITQYSCTKIFWFFFVWDARNFFTLMKIRAVNYNKELAFRETKTTWWPQVWGVGWSIVSQ